MTGLGKLTMTESKLFFRHSPTVGYAVGVPLVTLVILGLIPSFRAVKPEYDGLRLFEIYLPVLIGMALVIIELNLLPAHLASYREKGILLRLSTTPMRPSMLLAAHVVVSLAVSTCVAVVMVLVGGVLVGTPFLPGNLIGFVLPFMLTAASMITLGLVIAARADSELTALGIGFGLFFPLLFLAGLWTPGPMMPEVVRTIGEFTPLAAGVQAMQTAWTGGFPSVVPLLVLAGYTAVSGFAAVRLFRWE